MKRYLLKENIKRERDGEGSEEGATKRGSGRGRGLGLLFLRARVHHELRWWCRFLS